MKTVLKTLFVCMLCAISLTSKAQLTFDSFAGFKLGRDTYTPLYIGNEWAIDEWEGGFNIWRAHPYQNWGNYKFYIDKSGNVGIGKKPTTYKLEVNGSVQASSYKTTSDARLKSNITNLSGCLNKLNLIQGKSYYKSDYPMDYKKEVESMIKYKKIAAKDSASVMLSLSKSQKQSSKRQFGVIAQDLQKVFPELVSEDGNGYLSVDYAGLIPVLIEAIKEQQKMIDKQTQEIKELSNK